METIMSRSFLLASAFLICVSVNSTFGQQYSPNTQTSPASQPVFSFQQKQTQQNTTQRQVQQPKLGNQSTSPQPKQVAPWRLSSRIHLEKGQNKGYLVVQLDLADGYHVYSLNPDGSPSPTKLAVLPTNDLKVQSKFMSDKSPKVIEKDPVFQQRIEKHTGQVQFFASIIVRPGVDPEKLKQEIQFSGQICSESACQPIRDYKANAEFSGYFVPPKARSASETQQLK